MAKIEKSAKKSSKKANATKRKHDPSDDDAVPDKSVILSDETAKLPIKKQILKKSKRKSTEEPQSAQISKKRKATSSDEGEDEEMHGPTLEQLKESEKPENTNAVLTIRQKKRQKLQQRLNAQRDESGNKEMTRNAEYLQKWKHNRGDWKFEKLRQISIQNSVFDETKVNKDLWPIAVEYLSGSKGTAKEKITKAAEAVIDELDKQANSLSSDSSLIMSSEKYRRARELLQSFD